MKPAGIWLNDQDFVQFGEPDVSMSEQLATRSRSIDFYALGMYLPNPDLVLRELGKSHQIYRDLRGDAHVGGSIRRRKAAVKALERGIDQGNASDSVTQAVRSIFARLPMDRIISEMLDAPLHGYQPMEIMWGYADGLQAPVDIIGKPANWFVYDLENQPRFLTKDEPTTGIELPDKKFLIPRQDATYENPYGFPDLSMCFWPTTFKKGGLKFWVKFAEKYGAPWVIGKQPRNTPDPDRDRLLDDLYNMVQDAVAVIPDDSSIEIKEASNGANNATMFESLLMFCRSEVSIALIGQNQTTEATSNRASAQIGHQVTRDIRDGDSGILKEELNRLIDWICEVNWGPNCPRPTYSMWEQETVDETQANRDFKLSQAGARFTPAYFRRAYNLQLDDVANVVLPPSGDAVSTVSFAEPAPSASKAAIDKLTNQLETSTQPVVDGWIDRIRKIVSDAKDLSSAQDALLLEFGELDETSLADVMGIAFSCARLQGRSEVADGN